MYGIGPVTARRLYDNGLRTIDDLRNYYGVDEFEDADLNDPGHEADESNDVKVAFPSTKMSASRTSVISPVHSRMLIVL